MPCWGNWSTFSPSPRKRLFHSSTLFACYLNWPDHCSPGAVLPAHGRRLLAGESLWRTGDVFATVLQLAADPGAIGYFEQIAGVNPCYWENTELLAQPVW